MLSRLKSVLLITLFAASTLVYPWLVMGPLGDVFAGPRSRLAAFVLLTLGGMILLKLALPRRGWGELGCLAALLDGAVYQAATFLPEISSYPLSLGWSETSRFYYASLFFSPQLYGFAVPPSILHPTRYLMQAVPFLVPGAPLWLHRLWQVFLWLATTSLTAVVLVRRLRRLPHPISNDLNRKFAEPLVEQRTIPPPVETSAGSRRRPSNTTRPAAQFPDGCYVLFAFLFLFQGPVYYHLLVMVILVAWGVDLRRPRRSLIVIVVASIWAGLSRVNWLPVPGLLAAALYLLEIPRPAPHALRSVVGYLQAPAIWVVLGTAAGWLMQTAYRLFSGNPPEYFGSSFTSDLLWYRLLPNATYPQGILLSTLLVSLPMLLATAIGLIRLRDGLRGLGLATILGALLAVGIIVSVKIGGGSNLHNLDAFLVLLLVVGGYCYVALSPGNRIVRAALTILVLLPPLFLTSTAGGRWNPPAAAAARGAIATLRAEIEPAAQAGGEILFIRERQLLMFGDLPDLKLVPDDEVVFLMEMVMGNNRAYLGRFYDDLRHHRFALIVVDPQNTGHQGRLRPFGEENDAWADRVAIPLMCAYEPLVRLDEVNLVILKPRPELACPLPEP